MIEQSLFRDTRFDLLLEELWQVKGWPQDATKDDALIRSLVRQYPSLNLIEEIRQWAVWMQEHESKKKVNHRVRLQRWCSNAVQWRSDRRLGGKGARPAIAGATDPTEAARLGWSGSLPPAGEDA